MKKLFSIAICICFAVLFLNGCASVGNKVLKEETSSTVGVKIVKGETTKQEILDMFGDPYSSDFTDSGNLVYKYQFTKTHAKATNFIPIVSLFNRGAEGNKKELVVFFDKNEIVQNYSMSTSEVDVNTGLFQ